MNTFKRLTYLAALACACIGATAHAADDDAINPDRPDFVESSQVVGKGRLQLETGGQWDRQRDDGAHQRTLTTPTLLRIGIGESAELRVETDGRTVNHATDPSSGAHASQAGYADTAIGIKWHLVDQQGDRPSVAVLVDAELPSGSSALRGHGVRPALSVPAEWDLADGWGVALMPGIGIDRNDGGGRYGYGLFAITLEKELTERAHTFLEFAAPQIARADNGGTQMMADTGLTWLVNKDCQVDVMVGHGLNRRTPDLSLGFGISIRR
jgi:hypothetical protein